MREAGDTKQQLALAEAVQRFEKMFSVLEASRTSEKASAEASASEKAREEASAAAAAKAAAESATKAAAELVAAGKTQEIQKQAPKPVLKVPLLNLPLSCYLLWPLLSACCLHSSAQASEIYLGARACLAWQLETQASACERRQAHCSLH